MKTSNTRRGFTLIELLVVVLIIGILAAVAVPQYQKAVIKSRVAEAKVGLSTLQKAAHIAQLENNNPYMSYADLDQLSIELPESNYWNYAIDECLGIGACRFYAYGKNAMNGYSFSLTDKAYFDVQDDNGCAGFCCSHGGSGTASYVEEFPKCKQMGFTKEYNDSILME